MAGTIGWPKSNHNHASEYQVAGIPFVKTIDTSSTDFVLEFPRVTQFITLRNTGSNDIKIGFSSGSGKNTGISGTGTSYYILETGTQSSFKIRCKEVHFNSPQGPSQISIFAGLTNCVDFFKLDGEGIDG